MKGEKRQGVGRMMPGLLAGLVLAGMVFSQALAGPKGRLDPTVADSLAAEAGPLQAADYYNEAWENDKALDVLKASGASDAATLWRIARSEIDKGENLEDDAAEPLYTSALDQARKAVELDPKSADSHLMVAIAAGRMALLRGPFKAAGLVKEAFQEAHLAAALSDSIPVALYVIGRTHKKLMEKPGIVRKLAGLDFAAEDSIPIYFDKALAVSHGNMIQCNVEYADYLLEYKDDKVGAKQRLEAALALPVRDEQDPKAQERAKKMLDEL